MKYLPERMPSKQVCITDILHDASTAYWETPVLLTAASLWILVLSLTDVVLIDRLEITVSVSNIRCVIGFSLKTCKC